MANVQTRPVIGDIGSQEMANLLVSYNALVDTLGTLITTLKTVADVNAIKAAAVIAEASLVANVAKISSKPSVPLNPRRSLTT